MKHSLLFFLWVGSFFACHHPSPLPIGVVPPSPQNPPSPVLWRPQPLPNQSCLPPPSWQADLQMPPAPGFNTEVSSLGIDRTGNIYVTGYRDGLVNSDTDIDPAGNSSAFLTKYSPSGTQVWSAQLDTAGTDTGESIAIHPTDGRIYLTGRTDGSFPNFVNQGQFDLYLASFTPDGEMIDLIQVGNERPQHPTQVVLDAYYTPLLGGYDDMYIKDLAVVDNQDPFMVAFDVTSDFHFLINYHHQYRTATADFMPGIAVDGTTPIVPIYEVDGSFLDSYNDQGFFRARIQVTHSFTQPINAIARSPVEKDYFYAIGYTLTKFGDHDYGNGDLFLIKYNKNTYQPVWSKQAGSSEADWPTALAFDSHGNIYVAGATDGTFPNQTKTTEDDMFVAKFTPDGQWIGSWQQGTNGLVSMPATIAIDACDRVFLGGYVGVPNPSHEPTERVGFVRQVIPVTHPAM